MLVSVNGVRLFFEVLGPKLVADGPKWIERPTVVALHGGPTDHGHMRDMVESLADVAQVVVYDHRGCGRSDPGDPALWTLAQWGDDVRGLCDALGIEQPVVIGHSFGGMVAQSYAIRHPGHAARLVFSGTGPFLDPAISAEGFRRQGGDEAAAAFAAFAAHPGPKTVTDFGALCLPLYSTTRRTDPDADARTRTNYPLLFDFFGRETKAFHFVKALAGVTTPVLILSGDEDPVLPPPYQDAIEAALVNAPVRRVSYPGVGHNLARDAPGALDADLRAWVLGG
jgi:proline iminopeptidase